MYFVGVHCQKKKNYRHLNHEFSIVSFWKIDFIQSMNHFLSSLATLSFVGRLPKGPGTWGTIATLPLVAFLMWLGPLWHMGFTLLFFPLALWSTQAYEAVAQSHDAKEIVIDESLGILITLVSLPLNWKTLLLGFIFFRILDIWKPFPIGYLDKNVKGPLGVIADDAVAGIFASILLQVIFQNTDWLRV